MVNRDDYKAMLEKAVTELSDLLAQRDALDTERERMDARIAELKQGIIALGPLAGVNPQTKYSELLPEYDFTLSLGLKDAVMAVLDKVEGDEYITPVVIRDRLESTGYEIKSKNILPSIHTVLKRFEGRQVEAGDVNGKTGYRLIRADRPPKQSFFQTALKRAVQDAIHPSTREESTLPLTRQAPNPYKPVDGQALYETKKLTRNRKG